jgi:probable addiction module antidote protein
MVSVSEFDPSAFLDDDEVVAEYLTAVLEDANPKVFLAAVGHVAKAGGMSAIAERADPSPRDLLAESTADPSARWPFWI